MISQNSVVLQGQEKIELFVGIRELADELSMSVSSLKVKLFMQNDGNYELIGETEAIENNSRPDFSKTFIVDYFFEVSQKLKFQVFHKQVLIGETLTTLGTIVGGRNQTLRSGLEIVKDNKKIGKLIIRFENILENNASVSMTFQAQIQSDKPSWIDMLDVFGVFSAKNYVLKLYRITDDTEYVPIFESEVIENQENPAWKQLKMRVSKLCNSDYFRPVKARVFNRSKDSDALIGETQFTLDELTKDSKFFILCDPRTRKQTGTLNLTQIHVDEKDEFLDYIRGGTQLNVILGVDFTASNGDPDMLDSLHSLKFDGTMNEYQRAIQSVCSILLEYDTDKKVLAFGFGGKPRFPNFAPRGVQHCFPLTGDLNNPWVSDLNGIMHSYSDALNNTDLSGPTLFAPILHKAMEIAQYNKAHGSIEYTILLLITDGEIHDMESSINCLIKSADLPLSVIIVGVGKENFKNMMILDGDNGLINAQGVKAERDLVQFVPFRDFQDNAEKLAEHVLEEVPNQLVKYMERIGLKPKSAPQFSLSMIRSQV